jgi:hypothetical protein
MNTRELMNLWADTLFTTTRPQIRDKFFDRHGRGCCAVGVLHTVLIGRVLGIPPEEVTSEECFPYLYTTIPEVPSFLQSRVVELNDLHKHSFQEIGRWLKDNLPSDPDATLPGEPVVDEAPSPVDLVLA